MGVSVLASGKGAPSQAPSSTFETQTPLMVWAGMSSIGLLRAEIWGSARAESGRSQTLIIKSTSGIGEGSFRGCMTNLPTELSEGTKTNAIFVWFLSANGDPLLGNYRIVAAVENDGALRLFEGVGISLRGCRLAPAH